MKPGHYWAIRHDVGEWEVVLVGEYYLLGGALRVRSMRNSNLFKVSDFKFGPRIEEPGPIDGVKV